MLRRTQDLRGFTIEATDGDIGEVDDFLVDDGSWVIRYIIADTAKWWPGKRVLVAPSWIQRVDWDHSKVHVIVTRARIKDSPEYDPAKPVQRDYETQLYNHHGQPHYWGEYRPTDV